MTVLYKSILTRGFKKLRFLKVKRDMYLNFYSRTLQSSLNLSQRSLGTRVKQILTGTGRPSLSIFPFYIKGNHSLCNAFHYQL